MLQGEHPVHIAGRIQIHKNKMALRALPHVRHMNLNGSPILRASVITYMLKRPLRSVGLALSYLQIANILMPKHINAGSLRSSKLVSRQIGHGESAKLKAIRLFTKLGLEKIT